jgi:hypothetical protein
MAGVFDRPMFQRGGPHTVARDRLKKMGNIQDYASEGMFGTGGTMEDTGFRYQQPLGYGEGQVDPGILGAVRQRDMRGSQIVQGGDLSKRDVPMLKDQRKDAVYALQDQRNAALQAIKAAQLSNDPNKFAAIRQLEADILDLDQKIKETAQSLDREIMKTSAIEEPEDFGPMDYAQMGSAYGLKPMGPGEMDIFQSTSERAAAENLKQKPPVFGGAPAQKPVVTAAEAQVQNQSGPSGMEMEARKLPKDAQAVQQGPTGMEAEVLGRKGTITPADVAAGLNDPKPEVREKTALDFAKQFSDMSTKYEGLDKGLMLAQIGFAIAAGESPNAMKNIADGLSAGAGMMIQEKQAKNEFDRQIQLAAMQYGLGGAGKLETEKRAMAREGKAGSFFVADKDVTFGGRKYAAGDNVFVPNSLLWEGGLPAGLSTESSYSALQTAQATVQKALLEANKTGVVDGDEYKSVLTGLNDAADKYASANSLMPVLENALVEVTEDNVTGIAPFLKDIFNQAANAFGLKPLAEYESRQAYTDAMTEVTTKMVTDLLGENGNNVSNQDRLLVNELNAVLQSVESGLVADSDLVRARVQKIMQTLEARKNKSLAVYNTYMEAYGGTTTKSGAPMRSIYAEEIFSSPEITATVDENGVFVLSTVGN